MDGDLESAKAALAEGVRLSREVGDLYNLEMLLVSHGCATLIDGDLEESKPLFMEALQIARQIDDRVAQYALLNTLGCHAAGTGQPQIAARLLGAAEDLQLGLGARLLPFLTPLVTEANDSVEEALGTPIGSAAPVEEEPSPLSQRETEVAQLVAEGLRNKQIAARLLISSHTVDSHVRHIMNKLGLSSRAQIAAWSADRSRSP